MKEGYGSRTCLVQVPAPKVLERIAKRELNLTLVVAQRAIDLCTTIRRLIGIMAGLPELGVVENVEHFRAELQLLPLGDIEILECRKIKVHLAWPDQVAIP